MLEMIKREWQAQAAVGLFIVFTVWWVFLKLTLPHEANIQNQLFAASYGLMALWGGFWGIRIARNWGGLKSVFGRSIMMFSIGLLFQLFGQLSYSYYIYILHIEVPYPSLGDMGFFGSIPFYIYGIWLLGSAAGAHISLQSFKNKVQAIVIPILLLVFSYFFFLQGYVVEGSNPLKIILDFGYPLGQALYISIAILVYLLSRATLGGIMKSKVLFILFALLVQYVADYTFLYQASNEQWYAGGVNDYIYLVSYFIMTLSLLQLETVFKKLRVT